MWQEERADALRVATQLNIPFLTWDVSARYRDAVAGPMIAGYRNGITPNPDVECNRHIKFGYFYERAMRAGADFVATGHYARIVRGQLATAKDTQKDQTYFLWAIPKGVLQHTLFPIGHLTKPDVRKIATQEGLITAQKRDSQGVCFVGPLDVKSFLAGRIRPKKGNVIHTDGRVLGTHDGAAYYTIGQRHGLDIKDGGGPYFVVKKDIKKNIVIVGPSAALLGTDAHLIDMQWFGKAPLSSDIVKIKVRYRTPAVSAKISRSGKVQFTRPVRAIAPGQSAVVYRGSRVLGGGILSIPSSV